MNLLPANLATLATLAGEEYSRYSLSGVRVHFDHDGTYTAEATDGKYLAVISGPSPDPDTYPALPAVANAPNTATESVIPAPAWSAAFKALPKGRKASKPILRHLALSPSWDTTTLASTDLEKESVATVRNVDARYPDTDFVVRDATKGEPAATICLSPARLAQLLKVAQAVADTVEGGAAPSVVLEIRDPGKPLVVRADGAEGQRFVGLLMPIG